MSRAMEHCGRHRGEGDKWIDASIAVSVKRGVFQITGVEAVHVRRGAPMSPALDRCLRALFTEPLTVEPPPPPPEAVGHIRENDRGRWQGLPDIDGTIVAEVAFGDDACDPGPAR